MAGSTALLPPYKRESGRVYLEALLHYAGACWRRPGSWEVARPFEFTSYDDCFEDGRYADRWF